MVVRLWRCNRASDFWGWLVELYSFLYSGVGWKTEGRQASVPELYWGRDMALRGGAPLWCCDVVSGRPTSGGPPWFSSWREVRILPPRMASRLRWPYLETGPRL